MIFKILFLILAHSLIAQQISKENEIEPCNEEIREHIAIINELTNVAEKTTRIGTIYDYIKKYFLKNKIQYIEHSLQEIGFIGYSQKTIYSRVKGMGKTSYNIIVPIEIQYDLKNNLAIAIVITLLNNLKTQKIENSLNIYFIEDDSHKQISTISSRLLLNNNVLEKNTSTIYLMLNADKENNPIEFKNQSNIINSKTNLSFLEMLVKTFESNKVNFNVSKINDKNINEIYNLYLEEEIPILIMNNNKEISLLKYFKHNNLCDIYKSIENIIKTERNLQNENDLHYVIINTPFKKWIINESTLLILIYAVYNLIILMFIRRFTKASIIIRKVQDNYYKIIRLFFILFLSTYISVLVTNKIFTEYENFIDYSIINPIYLVNFFLILFNFNLLSYFTYNFKMYLNFRELKYLAIAISGIELIMLLYIKIEFILMIILKTILILFIPNKKRFIKKIIIILIWTINFILITSIQTTSLISKPIALSYFISISLFSPILVNMIEHLKNKTTIMKQEFKKSEKIESIIFFLIIAILIISNNMSSISTMKITQIISFPEKTNKISIEYLKENRNAIQIATKDFNLNLDKNEKQISREIKIQKDLINISFQKINVAERTIYGIKISTKNTAKQINLFLKNASEFIIYQSNVPYKIASNNAIFTVNNIKSNTINIAFTVKSQEDIRYDAFVYFDTNKNYVKIYDKGTKKEDKNIKIDYSYSIKYSGTLPKAEKYDRNEFFKLQDDREIENLKNLDLV
ncbi:hypothetical protein CR532_00995 [Candidatus Borreliella tachyglossi]|uniref:Uncharacterized protein n=1 Tax=Candidatus Borreliella tachyglossi TaxID=1964448 RepID=A0A2S1LWA5_9SPIR|nr:hypothetical protein [Candidatus Borreliella tachyglossi]AWG42589.1 hypothetical protein CR532_00995 [Candidatus Borreliella tachyglossi]